MAIQTTYNDTLDAGRVGALVDTNDKALISRNVEGAAIGFGLPVVQGVEDYGCRLATTGDLEILGISVRDRSTFDDVFDIGESARVMRNEGTIWVMAAATVVAGDPVHVVLATAEFSNTGGLVIPGARYDTSGTAGSLVVLRLA